VSRATLKRGQMSNLTLTRQKHSPQDDHFHAIFIKHSGNLQVRFQQTPARSDKNSSNPSSIGYTGFVAHTGTKGNIGRGRSRVYTNARRSHSKCIGESPVQELQTLRKSDLERKRRPPSLSIGGVESFFVYFIFIKISIYLQTILISLLYLYHRSTIYIYIIYSFPPFPPIFKRVIYNNKE
jgi:hypothetical protein